jgi:hypothetical protein
MSEGEVLGERHIVQSESGSSYIEKGKRRGSICCRKNHEKIKERKNRVGTIQAAV